MLHKHFDSARRHMPTCRFISTVCVTNSSADIGENNCSGSVFCVATRAGVCIAHNVAYALDNWH